MEKLSLSIAGKEIPVPTGIGHLTGGLSGSGQDLIHALIIFALTAGIVLSLIIIAWGATQIILSKGDKQKMQQAREKITYAIIGLIVIFISFFIIGIIETFFGIKLLQFNLPLDKSP